jgi:gluconokinase
MSVPFIILLMGVAGSGKTTVGRLLAQDLKLRYHEADDFHSAANKAKMTGGTPLDDEDRAPWLAAIRARMEECVREGQSAVFSCSALKEKYRQVLTAGLRVTLVYLSGDRELLLERLQGRRGHYMKTAMLDSQLATLEPPQDALKLDVRHSPAELVDEIKRHLAPITPGNNSN